MPKINSKRTEKEINDCISELDEKMWYNRHQMGKDKLLVESVTDSKLRKIYEDATKAAKKIEDKYKKEDLSFTDFEWGLLCGKRSALLWMREGLKWDETFDT